jgi:hypothetical protein
LTFLAILVLASPVCAGPMGTIWVEDGDAGQLPGTAQVVQGAFGPLTAIKGTIDTTNDVDMYLIHIANPAQFSATTVGQPGSLLDTQLFLFNQQGFGLEANDDAGPFPELRSTLTAVTNPTLEGNYLLAISAFNVDPVAPGRLPIFFPEPEQTASFGPVGPEGPGGGQPVADWTGTGGTGDYQIALVGAEFFVIPEPGTVLLWGLGLGGVAGFRLRRRKRAA